VLESRLSTSLITCCVFFLFFSLLIPTSPGPVFCVFQTHRSTSRSTFRLVDRWSHKPPPPYPWRSKNRFLREQHYRTRTRTNTNPYDANAIAVSRSGCACGAQKVRVCWGGVGRRRCRVALVCVVFDAFLGCLASSAFFVWCSPAGGCVQSTADF
jgi:hypothetical protein